jgi:acyl-[acyl-carrier-protein]-phospholipid O-acyltransferase/long-chain-fatty-acid--[acyl-carrier-protein] ligase
MAGVCVLPSVFMPMFSGFIADRFPKRYVVIAVNLLELPVFAFGAWTLSRLATVSDGYFVLSAVLLYSILAAFSTPSFDGILPETFSEPELSRACGRITSSGIFGLISGVVVMSCAYHYGWCFYILLAVVVFGFFSASWIFPVISPVQIRREIAYKVTDTLKNGLIALRASAGLMTAAVGEVFFIGLGVTAIPLLVLFSRYVLKLNGSEDITLLQIALSFGFLLGCFCAGIFSKNKIELGLVPLGALGMAIAVPLMVFFPGRGREIGLDLPGGFLLDFYVTVYPGVCFWTLFAGFSGGLLLVPLRTFVIQNVSPEYRGAALALKNMAAFVIGAIAMLLAVSCALSGGVLENLPPLLNNITSVMPRISFRVLLIGFGLTTFLFTALSMWVLPNFMLRFIILALGHSLYRLKITGAENIPERGPALLLCNHVSAVDSVLISACTSREIRFMLYEEYFSVPLIGAIARMTGFFRVPSARTAKSLEQLFGKVRKHLADGGLVCVFPEGRLSGNGLMREFKSGHERMLPENVDVPVIPVNISFAWGNIFSNFSTRQGTRRKVSFPFFSAVTFGQPVSPDMSRFEIRQRIAELGAEASLDELLDEVTLHHAAVKMAHRHPLRKIFSDCDGSAYSAMSLVSEAALLSLYIRKHVSSSEQ